MKSEGHLQAYSPIQPYALGCTRDEILMILLPLLCLLAGAGLGYYFQVYVLIPAAPLALMAVVGEGFASDVGLWWILLDASVAALALQIGYIAGSILHLRTAPISRHRPIKEATAKYALIGAPRPHHCQRGKWIGASLVSDTGERI